MQQKKVEKKNSHAAYSNTSYKKKISTLASDFKFSYKYIKLNFKIKNCKSNFKNFCDGFI